LFTLFSLVVFFVLSTFPNSVSLIFHFIKSNFTSIRIDIRFEQFKIKLVFFYVVCGISEDCFKKENVVCFYLWKVDRFGNVVEDDRGD